jgi:hypothetical protein
MQLEIEDISQNYSNLLPYSTGKSTLALSVWPVEAGNVSDLLTSLVKILRVTETSSHCWIFSSWGKIFSYTNGSVLEFIASREDEFTFSVEGFDRIQSGYALPSFEISFHCALDTFQDMLEKDKVSLGHGFSFGGWLVPRETKNLLLKNPKWTRGFFLFPYELDLSFNSGEEWERVRFFSSTNKQITDLYERAGARL